MGDGITIHCFNKTEARCKPFTITTDVTDSNASEMNLINLSEKAVDGASMKTRCFINGEKFAFHLL